MICKLLGLPRNLGIARRNKPGGFTVSSFTMKAEYVCLSSEWYISVRVSLGANECYNGAEFANSLISTLGLVVAILAEWYLAS